MSLYNPSPADQTARRALGKAALLVSVLLILFCGTFPFDLSFEGTSLVQQVKDKFFLEPDIHDVARDRNENILFFMPLGIALALLMPARPRPMPAMPPIDADVDVSKASGDALDYASIPRRTGPFSAILRRVGITLILLPAALIIGALTSAVIEITQAFIGSRDSAMTDVMNNTIGCAIGFVAFSLIGEFILWPVLWIIRFMRPYVGLRVMAGVTTAVAVAGIGSPLLTIGFGNLSRWDASYPLVLGRELVKPGLEGTYSWGFPRCRPWTGVISDVAIADRSITASEAIRLLADESVSDVFGSNLLAAYDLTGPGPYPDRQNLLPPLRWEGRPRERAARGVYLSESQWLITDSSVAPATSRIAQSDAFTVLLRLSPPAGKLFQEGPARILNIADGTTGVNLMIGHRDHDLVIRPRARLFARSGLAPECVLRGVFDTPGTKTILVSYDPWRLRAWFNEPASGREVRITPEMTILWHLYPRPNWWFPLGTVAPDVYAVAYRVILFAILGVLTAMTMRHTRLSIANRMLMLAVIVLIADVVLECIVALISPYAFRPFAPPAALIAAAFGIALVRQRGYVPEDQAARIIGSG